MLLLGAIERINMKYINYITHIKLDNDKEPSAFRIAGGIWVNDVYIKSHIKDEEFVIDLRDDREWNITIGDDGELSLPPLIDMENIEY